MRLLSVRLIVSLIVGVMLVSLCSSGYEVWVGKRNLRRDLQRRSEVLAESLAGSVERDLEKGAFPTLRKTVQRFANRENLIGMAVYDPQGNVIAITGDLASKMGEAPPVVLETLKENSELMHFRDWPISRCTSASCLCTAQINSWEPWPLFMTRDTFERKVCAFGAKPF